MYDIAKRTTIGAALLLIMPIIIWMSGWQWQPEYGGSWLRVLFWVTETVTSPWGILTSIILSIWFLWCLRFRLKPALGLLVIMAITVLVGQGIKSVIKEWVQESRPYVVWLERNHQVDDSYFYSLPRKERSELVKTQLQDQTQIPQWLRSHWQFETGFAFPSGHTLFAATWALLAVGLLWARRHYKTVVILMLWASGVMGSRLVLGMHWPQDLVVATLISWLLVVVASWLAQRWCGPLSLQYEEIKEQAEEDAAENKSS
ncbi:phosphatidylglycerophosphatase B [Pectobacterium versatile]|uniref:undecaprenyl-diphosphate phosphatase n=1 Tax=Pectobacterium polonicum TaxID=2485124 RepID=A0AAE9SZS1_9GAMM|nr:MULTISPECIES: phosphatidylglycerophosphatase B [Pectobacterium]GKW24292.1 phosphatidylglycerophosphatase B [Pectobacterium carotovorum subsp. carotovorum]MBQ4767532.1 phosphatidylglycerophosphatase B [Pectobacterium versatile]MDC9818093.1 phosphatidylglycerophosphatase B [Pectobacterium polonicum]TKY83960.1 phosphatidylglycerophosphatase B [Pectobacterium polonicum]UVO06652.1 phosphatidylglycerophosphatase B [Pectobacterium polonicum]